VDHPTAEGHFPGNPIIPGAVLLREILATISPAGVESGCEIRSAKFHQPVRPGDTVSIVWEAVRGEGVRFSCSIAGSDRPTVTGVLRSRPS
jgi:3-hydroxymyristoyl/3-hydroxydecanoyl-(acyl carrier protein) dehydratase